MINNDILPFLKNGVFSGFEPCQKMHTSRASLDRLLDPENTSITLHTLVRAAHVAGKKLHIELR